MSFPVESVSHRIAWILLVFRVRILLGWKIYYARFQMDIDHASVIFTVVLISRNQDSGLAKGDLGGRLTFKFPSKLKFLFIKFSGLIGYRGGPLMRQFQKIRIEPGRK